MESERQSTERETPPQHWTSWKLIIDPALTKGLYKVFRYDGSHFNIPVEDLPVGLFPVATARDPRICRLWSKLNKTELLAAKFKVDEWYVGPVPPKEVTFSRLNDNVREAFLTTMCRKYGSVEEVEIFYNPRTKKHLGVAKVVFDGASAARDAVRRLHQTSVMGNIIHVEIDPKGENRARYVQLLLRGLCTPSTLPVGGSERVLQGLIHRLLSSAAAQRQGSVSSPSSVATPLSLDTACSSIWQDTPCSFGLTPRSQGTPRTPSFSATPLSQDSCYSSLQATPVLQGEPSTSSLHKPLRRELGHRKPARLHRGSGEVSNVSFLLNQTHSLSAQLQTSNQQLSQWGPNAQSSAPRNPGASFSAASPGQESRDGVTAADGALHLNAFSILSFDFTAEQQRTASITELAPPAVGSRSLDSRIESLLINSHAPDPSYLQRETPAADGPSQDSPTSPCLADASPRSDDSPCCSPALPVGVGPAWGFENEEDETTRAVSFLTRNCGSPSDFTQSGFRAHAHSDEGAETLPSLLCPEPDKRSAHKPSTVLTQLSSLPQPPPFSSASSSTTQAPPAIRPPCPHPPVSCFPFPIPPFPPSIPPVPPRLPNGTIPIPPPGWIPPHHTGIPIPPPPIPPPAFLGAPPPLLVPPSAPPPVYPAPIQPADKPPLPFPRPPWLAPPFPRFNPFVPPPDFPPLTRENPHKVTAEKVLEAVVDELKLIIKRDIMRRMVEGVAFKAFEDWWDCEEKKTKIQVPPLKSGAGGKSKLINPLSRPGKKPPLPSFKVKRKRAEDPVASEEAATASGSTHDVKQQDDSFRSERPKRRHARPHELDSEDEDDDDDGDEEGKEEDKTRQRDETASDKVDVVVQDEPQILCDRDKDEEDDKDDDDDEDDEEDDVHPGEENVQKHTQEEDGASVQRKEVLRSDSESSFFSSSSSSSSSSSLESDYSSDFDSSDSFVSESFEDSSNSDLGPEDEDMEVEEEEDAECIVISSDEESMELQPPATPSAPLTPGALLELQDWLAPFHREEDRFSSCQQDACELDALMELQSSEPQDVLQLLSPIALPEVEPHLDAEMQSAEWSVESVDGMARLRPLTPTGCRVDSDPDLLMRSKPTSPAVEEAERPQTPGRGIVVELESEDSVDEVLSPTNAGLISALPDPSPYQDMPKTPGREDRSGWTQCSSGRAPGTPGRGAAMLENNFPLLSSPLPVPCLSSNPYITAPKTPGRDIILPRRALVHRRKTQMQTPRGSPVSPHSFSESLPEPTDGRGSWVGSGVRAKPLQGLENMPGLLDEENRTEAEKKRQRRLKRKWRIHQRSLKRISGSHSRPHRWRSLCEERRILHRVWKEGLDEEDARLLRCTYDRLHEQDNGLGWISSTPWTPHPLTKVVTETSEEHRLQQPQHRTGSARSEGFYMISRKDKLKYLNSTKPSAELPSTSTQGTCIPAQQQTSLRSGSDFRSEQRRLLSSFSCDSELLKFNQLKFRKKKIRFSRSHIHEWGLFAMEPIAADEMVIEYVGQIIRQGIADMREQRYEDEGIGSSYLFRVDQDTIIDATKCGNLARFINHSCNPNCYAKIVTVESQKKIVIYSRQPIGLDEEITYDYKFPIEETKIPCLCAADGCRGSLN